MILFRIIKLLFSLLWKVFLWTFGISIFLLFLVGLLSVFIFEQQQQQAEWRNQSTDPFPDSIFQDIERYFYTVQEPTANENQKLKFLSDCVQKLPNSHYTRYWEDFTYQKRYENTFEVTNQLYCEAYYNKYAISVEEFVDEQTYWGNVYGKIARHDTTQMQTLYDYFEKIRAEKQLDYIEFAHMIVSFVQSIPYTLVLSSTKEQAIQQGGVVKEYLLNQQGPYIENIKYGLFSPIEFCYSLRGDCDTRTLLIYCLLSHFGYDVVILNCSVHSMIGLNLPAQGKYFQAHDGTQYYFWETTNEGWQLGQMPPDYENDRWYIALPSVNRPNF